MLENRCASRRLLARLVLVGLVLRVAVPVGFMPTNLNDGWFLKLCPDGMSMSVMMALLGHDHHHHHNNEDSKPFQQCDLGGGLADECDPSTDGQLPTLGLAAKVQATQVQTLALASTARAFHARAPPPSRFHQNT